MKNKLTKSDWIVSIFSILFTLLSVWLLDIPEGLIDHKYPKYRYSYSVEDYWYGAEAVKWAIRALGVLIGIQTFLMPWKRLGWIRWIFLVIGIIIVLFPSRWVPLFYHGR